jgi:hypothetical protein
VGGLVKSAEEAQEVEGIARRVWEPAELAQDTTVNGVLAYTKDAPCSCDLELCKLLGEGGRRDGGEGGWNSSGVKDWPNEGLDEGGREGDRGVSTQ